MRGDSCIMDMQARYEKLLADAAECAVLRDRATDAEKRELFARLAEHLSVLASLMQRALGLQKVRDAQPSSPGLAPEPQPAQLLESSSA
jgi:hypothetical protein